MLIKIDFLLFLFKPNKFLPNILIINAVGVTTTKKTMPITIGDIKFPNKTPNLNQILFKGVKIDEFKKPKIKKIIAGIIGQILILLSLRSGNNAIIKKIQRKLFQNFCLKIFLFYFYSYIYRKIIILEYISL